MKSIMLMTVCAVMFAAATTFAEDSAAVTTQAWEALGKNDYAKAIALADKCVNTWGKQAKEMNAKLTALPGKDTAATYWAVNDVATCLFIKGQAQEKKGDKKGAIETYKALVKDYKYGQCWDPKGWFWAPAAAAKKKIVELSFDDE